MQKQLTNYSETPKNELRAQCRNIRRNMAPEEKAALDRRIESKLLNLWSLREANLVLIYVSTEHEIETKPLISTLLSRKIPVAVPRCNDGEGNMSFYRIYSFDDLEPGAYGLMEPIVEKCEKITDTLHSVCIIPAFMCDTRGYRLGHGKGYYDTFLTDFRGKKISICYDFEVADKLPHTSLDKTVDIVLTDKRTLFITKYSHCIRRR